MNTITLTYPSAGPGRVQLFDELRGLSVLMILTYHVCGVTGFANYTHGELGVDIFVLLSGAALTLSHRPGEGAFRFLWRRLARLLPAYWIALTLFWVGNVYWLNRSHTPTDVWSHYLAIHPWWGDRYFLGFNDSFWFLGMIVPLYFVYAVLRRWLDRMDIVLGAGLILSFAVAYFTAKVVNQPALFVHLGLRPPIFFLGLLVGVLIRDGVLRLPLSAWLGLGVLLMWYGTFVTGIFVGYNIFGFAVFLAYWALRANAPAAGQRWLCRGLAGLGLISYEVFLLHQPLIRDYNHKAWQTILGRAPDQLHIIAGAAIALLCTLPLAWELHRLAGKIGRLVGPRDSAAEKSAAT